jgi:cell division ATPase FtsA
MRPTTKNLERSRRRNQTKTVVNMAKEYKDLVVGLDIGTSKVMAVVAEVMADGQLKIAGLGIAPGNGLKRGVVVNIRGINSSGMVAIKDKEVTQADLARVMETARAINISSDQRLLLVAPQEFVIDSQEVKEPIGMSGMRLEAKVHIVTGAQSAAENIIKCVRRCGLEVDQLLLNPQSSSLAVLSEDERELGVVCVDIGAGTTDVAIFANGSIRHTAVIPIAGDLITSDIAMALRTPTKDAEDIKVESGNAKQLLADPDAQVEVPGLGDRGPRMLSRQALAGVIEQRGDAGHDRIGRGHLPQASAPGPAQVFRGAGRHGQSAACSDCDGSAGRGPFGPPARLQGDPKEEFGEQRFWPIQRLHCGELLMSWTQIYQARSSPPLSRPLRC